MVRMARTLDIIRAHLAGWVCQSRDTGVAEPPRQIPRTMSGRGRTMPPRTGGRGFSGFGFLRGRGSGGGRSGGSGGGGRQQAASSQARTGPRHSTSEIPLFGSRVSRSDHGESSSAGAHSTTGQL